MFKKFKEKDIDVLYIAGVFGNYINPDNAKIIGLIPDIKFMVTTVVADTKMALISKEVRRVAESLSKNYSLP